MRVTYLGPHDEVSIPSHGLICARGTTIDVPDELGAELVDREAGAQWEAVAPTKAAKAADKES